VNQNPRAPPQRCQIIKTWYHSIPWSFLSAVELILELCFKNSWRYRHFSLKFCSETRENSDASSYCNQLKQHWDGSEDQYVSFRISFGGLEAMLWCWEPNRGFFSRSLKIAHSRKIQFPQLACRIQFYMFKLIMKVQIAISKRLFGNRTVELGDIALGGGGWGTTMKSS